jgi:hypothetical protein
MKRREENKGERDTAKQREKKLSHEEPLTIAKI